MSSLFLIRHGQASFGADDYDVLSPRGIEQSRALGRHLAAQGERIDAVYVGPRRRHADTAAHLAAAAAEAGMPLPAPAAVAELDEFPAIEMLRLWLPKLAAEDPELAAAIASGSPGRAALVAFDKVTRAWATGSLDVGDLESFAAFAARVARGLDGIMRGEGRGRRVLVVTSGGPISIAVRGCLDLREEATLRAALALANASTTEIKWRGGETTMFGYNHVHYLPRELLTFR
ncbi:MAG TPA: histidine phosphatase family protein [Kofleriaceae bacterium]